MFSKAVMLGVQQVVSGDPYFANVELLLNGDSGVNDLSSNAATPTNTGSVSTSAGALVFSGSGQYLTFTGISAYEVTTSPWSVEAIFDPDTTSGTQTIFDLGGSKLLMYATTGSSEYNIYMDSNGGHNYVGTTGTTKVELGAFWDGATLYIALNGTILTSAARGSSLAASPTPTLVVGAQGTVNQFDGKLYSLRFTNGTCRHTSAYTPNPTDYYPTS